MTNVKSMENKKGQLVPDFSPELPPGKILSERGRAVLDTAKNAEWRQAYYKRISSEETELNRLVREARYNRDSRSPTTNLQVLGTRELAEYLQVSQSTASLLLRTQVIPSFTAGKRRYTHMYVLEDIRARGIQAVTEGKANNLLPRLVLKLDAGKVK